MNWLGKTFGAACIVIGLSGCDSTDDTNFSVEELTASTALASDDIKKRWLATILHSMQGKTGSYLKAAALKHGIEIGYADNLNHAVGSYSSSTNDVTLEIPAGLTETTFDELVLTGRAVMYHELDHAVREHESRHINGLSFEDDIDGDSTAHEAIAEITAFIGMSEDAAIGSAPPLSVQFGLTDNGFPAYYSVVFPHMADAVFANLEEGENFHEQPDVVQKAFKAFYDGTYAPNYTLRYGRHIPEDFLRQYSGNTDLSTVFSDYRTGRDISFSELSNRTTFIGSGVSLLEGLESEFASGAFTSEAEGLTVNDLLRRKAFLSRPDNGPANHLTRVTSGEGQDPFDRATRQEMIEVFETQAENAKRFSGFFSRCSTASYIPEDLRQVFPKISSDLSSVVPNINQMIGFLRQSEGELSVKDRLVAKNTYNTIHDKILYPASDLRVKIHNKFVEGQARQCTYKNMWP